MKISAEKHKHLKRFGLFLPFFLIAAAALFNAMIAQPSNNSRIDNPSKKDMLTVIPDAKNQEISEKDKAMDEISSLSDTSNSIPKFSEVTPEKNITEEQSKKDMQDILNSLDKANTIPPSKSTTQNGAYNENVPPVVYPPKEKKPVTVTRDEPVEDQSDKNAPAKEKIDPYAPNKSMTIGGGETATTEGKKIFGATVITESWVTDGDVINLRNTEDIVLPGVRIPRNTMLNGTVNISSSKMFITISLDDYPAAGGKYLEVIDAKQSRGIKLNTPADKTSAVGKATNVVDAAGVSSGLISRVRTAMSGVGSGKSNRQEYQVPGGFKIKLLVKETE